MTILIGNTTFRLILRWIETLTLIFLALVGLVCLIGVMYGIGLMILADILSSHV